MLRALSTLWLPTRFALLPQVRSHLGAGVDGLRIADVIVLEYATGILLYVEIKVDRRDWIEELLDPGKSDEIGQHCHGRIVAVPGGNARRVVNGAGELPDGWGLVVVDGGKATLAHKPTVADPGATPEELWFSMIRSALSSAQRETDPEVGAPWKPVTRPQYSRTHAILGCGHACPLSLVRGDPPRAPCFSCPENLPVDEEAALAAIEDASAAQLVTYQAGIDARTGGRR